MNRVQVGWICLACILSWLVVAAVGWGTTRVATWVIFLVVVVVVCLVAARLMTIKRRMRK